MVAIAFIILLSLFSLLCTVYIYQNNYKKNFFESITFEIEGDKSEVFQKIIESSKSHGWILVESSNEDYLRYKIPLSMFFWGGIVKVFLKSKKNKLEINIQKKPVLVKSEIQNSILEKNIAKVLNDFRIGGISDIPKLDI